MTRIAFISQVPNCISFIDTLKTEWWWTQCGPNIIVHWLVNYAYHLKSRFYFVSNCSFFAYSYINEIHIFCIFSKLLFCFPFRVLVTPMIPFFFVKKTCLLSTHLNSHPASVPASNAVYLVIKKKSKYTVILISSKPVSLTFLYA